MISEFKIGVVQCVSTRLKFSHVLTVKTFNGQIIIFFLDILLTEDKYKKHKYGSSFFLIRFNCLSGLIWKYVLYDASNSLCLYSYIRHKNLTWDSSCTWCRQSFPHFMWHFCTLFIGLVSLGDAHPHIEVFKTNCLKQWFALYHQVIHKISKYPLLSGTALCK